MFYSHINIIFLVLPAAYSVLCLRKVPPPITKIGPRTPPTTQPAGPVVVRTDTVTLQPSVTVYTDEPLTGPRRITGPRPTTPFIGIGEERRFEYDVKKC